MRSMRQRLSAAAIAAGLTTLILGLGAGPAQASLNGDCFSNAPDNTGSSLSVTTQPPADSDVPAGTSIQVTGHWDSHDWAELNRMATCTTSGGHWDPSMGSVTSITTDQLVNSFVTTVTIPADMPVGTEVCIHDVLFGGDSTSDHFSKDKSDEVCFHSAAAPVTTTTAPTTTTTTTAGPTTTTTMAPSDSSGAGAGGPASPGEQVLGEVASNPAPAPTGELPRTGSGSAALAGLGGLAVALGVITLALGRRGSVRA